MITLTEDLVPLAAASEHIPGRPHINTVRRWANIGVQRGPRVVRLETIPVGGRLFTSREAIERFCQAEEVKRPKPEAGDDTARRILERVGL